MSTTGILKGRLEFDSYGTQPEAILPLLEYRSLRGPVLDPCCGEGNILSVLHSSGYRDLYGVEVQEHLAIAACERLPGADILCHDFTELFAQDFDQPIQTIFTNPPYAVLDEFWETSMDILPRGGTLLFLIRLNVIGRVHGDLFDAGTGFKGKYVVRPRPSYGKKYRCSGDRINRCDHVVWTGPKNKVAPKHPATGCLYDGKPMKLSASTDSTEYAWFEWQKGHRNDGVHSDFVRLKLPKNRPRRRG